MKSGDAAECQVVLFIFRMGNHTTGFPMAIHGHPWPSMAIQPSMSFLRTAPRPCWSKWTRTGTTSWNELLAQVFRESSMMNSSEMYMYIYREHRIELVYHILTYLMSHVSVIFIYIDVPCTRRILVYNIYIYIRILYTVYIYITYIITEHIYTEYMRNIP